MIKPKCPCDYNCERRADTCHSGCEAYRKWKKKLEEYNTVIFKEKLKRQKIIRTPALNKRLDEITRKKR